MVQFSVVLATAGTASSGFDMPESLQRRTVLGDAVRVQGRRHGGGFNLPAPCDQPRLGAVDPPSHMRPEHLITNRLSSIPAKNSSHKPGSRPATSTTFTEQQPSGTEGQAASIHLQISLRVSRHIWMLQQSVPAGHRERQGGRPGAAAHWHPGTSAAGPRSPAGPLPAGSAAAAGAAPVHPSDLPQTSARQSHMTVIPSVPFNHIGLWFWVMLWQIAAQNLQVHRPILRFMDI